MVMGAGWAMWGNNSPVITRVDVDICFKKFNIIQFITTIEKQLAQ